MTSTQCDTVFVSVSMLGYTTETVGVSVCESINDYVGYDIEATVKTYSVSGSIVDGPSDCTGIVVTISGSNN
jgi:hypothetical protein